MRWNRISPSPPWAWIGSSGSSVRLHRSKGTSPSSASRRACQGCGLQLSPYMQVVPNVPSKDYARQLRALWPEVRAAIDRTLLEDEPVLGASVERFEEALARA